MIWAVLFHTGQQFDEAGDVEKYFFVLQKEVPMPPAGLCTDSLFGLQKSADGRDGSQSG